MLGCEMISIIDYLLPGTQTNSLGFANKCQTPIADADHIEISIIHDRGSAVMSSKGFSSDLCYNTFERYTETSDPLEQPFDILFSPHFLSGLKQIKRVNTLDAVRSKDEKLSPW